MGSFSNKQKNDALFEYSLEKKSSSSQCGQIFFEILLLNLRHNFSVISIFCGKILDKLEKISEDSLDSIPSLSVKIQIGKFTWGNKAKHCWLVSTNFVFKSLFTKLKAILLRVWPHCILCRTTQTSTSSSVFQKI